MVKRSRVESAPPAQPAKKAAVVVAVVAERAPTPTIVLVRAFIDALGMSLADVMRLSMEAQMLLLDRRSVRAASAKCVARFIEPRAHADGLSHHYMGTTLTSIVRKACWPMAWFSNWKGHECDEYNAAFDLLSCFLDLCMACTKQRVARFTDLCEKHAGLCATARVCVESSKLRMLFWYKMMYHVRDYKLDTSTLATNYWEHFYQYQRRVAGLLPATAISSALYEARLQADAMDRMPTPMIPERTRHALMLNHRFQETPAVKGTWMRAVWSTLLEELSLARSFTLTHNLLRSTHDRILTLANLIGGDTADDIRYLFALAHPLAPL